MTGIRTFGKILILLISISLAQSCVKDNIDLDAYNEQDQIIPGENGNDSSNGNGTGGKDTSVVVTGIINFNVNIYDMIIESRSSLESTPIKTNRYVDVYSYNDNILIREKQYFSKGLGTISPTDEEPLSMPPGSYQFFAPGVNTPHIKVNRFFDGKQSPVYNNIDYVWYKTPSTQIESGAQTVTLNMEHCCTQVIVCLTHDSDITIRNTPTMYITPSVTEGASWSLFTGVITPAREVNSVKTSLGVSQTNQGYYGQIIMIPLKMRGNLNFTLNAYIDQQTVAQNLTINLPVYQNELKAGYAYLYTIHIENNRLTFKDASITNWVEVDAGKPIIITPI